MSYSDLIKNEMIKTSCELLLAVYIKLFNLVLSTGLFPSIWCEGIITPIFEPRDKTDTGNYRGICVSSCLGKFFSTTITDRLLEFVESRNILHPSQIGFLKANRMSNHIFTLRTLIEKYCYQNKRKIYACFVDFRKAFDSVWHEGLFHHIFQYGIKGNVYELIKSLYSKNSCSVKIGKYETSKFSYRRGVRQGCILGPLLFNLFVNELLLSFNCNKTDPFTLPNGTKLNSLHLLMTWLLY